MVALMMMRYDIHVCMYVCGIGGKRGAPQITTIEKKQM